MSIKKSLLLALGGLCCFVLWNASLIHYGIEQGWGQLTLVWKARPVSEVLSDTLFSDSLKQKLHLVERVKKFATDSLQLNVGQHYTTMFDQQGEEVMWVVSACKPFELTPKTWKFPIVGNVPYKGFFNRQHAFDELRVLQQEGWDTDLSHPEGWSTLGVFDEPILSGMLQRSDGDLANLIIHEMVHATIFVKDSVTFNENLAAFIADIATRWFLKKTYGSHSTQYSSYTESKEKRKKMDRHMLHGMSMLDSLYETFTLKDSFVARKQKKTSLIRAIVTALDTLSIHPEQLSQIQLKTTLPNNAYFMIYRRYRSEEGILKSELHHKYGGNVGDMVHDYKHKFPFL